MCLLNCKTMFGKVLFLNTLTLIKITFYYNPYDIGCYALGGVEVHITREEMQGL